MARTMIRQKLANADTARQSAADKVVSDDTAIIEREAHGRRLGVERQRARARADALQEQLTQLRQTLASVEARTAANRKALGKLGDVKAQGVEIQDGEDRGLQRMEDAVAVHIVPDNESVERFFCLFVWF
jgi:chromosome segregation ATPase